MFRILVAEDDESTRLLMCEVLRQAGYEPCPARVDACRREWDTYIDSVFAYQRAGGHRPLPCFGA